MRPGIASYTEEADDRAFIQVGRMFMIGLAERLTSSGKAGEVESIIVNLKYSVLLMTVKGGHVALSADRADDVEVL